MINMTIYTITARFEGHEFVGEYEFKYSLDAINTFLDDYYVELTNLKGNFSLTCVKKDN
jgi:hypothetical protein